MPSPRKAQPACKSAAIPAGALLWLAGSATLAIALLALTVARLAHWWTQPLGVGPLALLALWWMAAGTLLRHGGDAAREHWRSLHPWHLPLSTGLVVWGSLVISLPGTPVVPLVLYWLWVLLAEAGGWGWWCLHRIKDQIQWPCEDDPAESLLCGEESVSRPPLAPEPPTPAAEVSPKHAGDLPDPMDDPHLLQHWQHWDQGTRQRWSGWVRVRRRAGENSDTVHVAFCPPMDQVPEVHCEPVAGAEAEVELVRVYAHGVQLRVRWPAAAAAATEEPSWTVVALEAVAQASSGDSARAA